MCGLAFFEKEFGELEVERGIDVDGVVVGDDGGFEDTIEDAVVRENEVRGGDVGAGGDVVDGGCVLASGDFAIGFDDNFGEAVRGDFHHVKVGIVGCGSDADDDVCGGFRVALEAVADVGFVAEG